MNVYVKAWHDAIESARIRGAFSTSTKEAACDPRRSPEAELRTLYDLPCKRGIIGEPIPVVNGYVFPVGDFSSAVCRNDFDGAESLLKSMETATEEWIEKHREVI